MDSTTCSARRRSRRRAWGWGLRLGLVFATTLVGCSDPGEPCEDDGGCGSPCDGSSCHDTDGGGQRDASVAPDASPCDCAPGEWCDPAGGGCVADCRPPAATPCAGSSQCDYLSGQCVAPDTAGTLVGEGTACGDATCLPGTECSLEGECQPAPPCRTLACDAAACWPTLCEPSRPAGQCAPATLARLNEADFIAGGDGGAFDLEFDDSCNAYTVTMISGPDYLRQVAPDGTLTVWTGVTNLNMGEVAVRRLAGGEFGSFTGPGQVALSYICCSTCGCQAADPQGVARLDRESATTSLPMVIEATPSQGDGPFGLAALDTGPYGLTWGRDNRLYVGNVAGQGDFVRADLDQQTVETIHELGARIQAAAVFAPHELLVALEGGDLVRVHDDLPLSQPFAALGRDVTSLVRDPFTGRVYVSTREALVIELDAQGALLRTFASTPSTGRLAYAPDGYLYFLVKGWPGPAQVLRFELPPTL